MLAGACLFCGYAFQTAGLKLTTASKAAFLTGLAVLLVPLLSSLVYRVYPHGSEVIGVLVATLGMGLMTLDGNARGLARGDTLEILCALAFAGHIVVLGHYLKFQAFEPLAVWQLGTTAALALAGFWWLEKPYFHPHSSVLWVALPGLCFALDGAGVHGAGVGAANNHRYTRGSYLCARVPVVAGIFSFTIMGERLPAKAVVGSGLDSNRDSGRRIETDRPEGTSIPLAPVI